VLFVCTHNAGRSIVAAALLNAHQPPGVRADSAGTDPTDALNPTVVTALAERGIGLEGVAPVSNPRCGRLGVPWARPGRNRPRPSMAAPWCRR
jgi:hypothetical protein